MIENKVLSNKNELKQHLKNINEENVSYMCKLMNKWINGLKEDSLKADVKIKNTKTLHHRKRHTMLYESVEYQICTSFYRYDIIVDIPTYNSCIDTVVSCYLCIEDGNRYVMVSNLNSGIFDIVTLNYIKKDILKSEIDMINTLNDKTDGEEF